jgi:hypothetical protein
MRNHGAARVCCAQSNRQDTWHELHRREMVRKPEEKRSVRRGTLRVWAGYMSPRTVSGSRGRTSVFQKGGILLDQLSDC